MITRKFTEIYPSEIEFSFDYSQYGNIPMTNEEINQLYFLLLSRYAESNIRYTNEVMFSIKLFRIVNTYYPTLLANLREQKKLRESSDEDFMRAGKTVSNIASHNSEAITTDTDVGISQLDGQTVTNTQSGKLMVIANRLLQLQAGYEEEFLRHFTELFVMVLYTPKEQFPLYTPEQLQDGDNPAPNPDPSPTLTREEVQIMINEALINSVWGGTI